MYPAVFKQLCSQILEDGRRRYELSMAIVSHIYADNYEVVAVSSETNVFVTGECFKLKDTYCREVMTLGKTIALTETEGQPGLQEHPLYEAMALKTYISTPIFLLDSIWGTLNFSSMEARTTSFTAEDIEWIENAAREITQSLISLDLF